MRRTAILLVGLASFFGPVTTATAQEQPPPCVAPLMDKISAVMAKLDINKVPDADMQQYTEMLSDAMKAGSTGHMDEVCPKLEDLLDYAKTLRD